MLLHASGLDQSTESKFCQKELLHLHRSIAVSVSQNSVGIDHGVMSKLHADSTSAAPHKTQGKRKADGWKIDCERRREEKEHKTLLRFPSPKTLNYYYWVLIFYFNIVHTCGPIRNKSLWHAHMIRLPVFCYDAVRSRSYMPDHT